MRDMWDVQMDAYANSFLKFSSQEAIANWCVDFLLRSCYIFSSITFHWQSVWNVLISPCCLKCVVSTCEIYNIWLWLYRYDAILCLNTCIFCSWGSLCFWCLFLCLMVDLSHSRYIVVWAKQQWCANPIPGKQPQIQSRNTFL